MTSASAPPKSAGKREVWFSQYGFLMAAIGSAIGLGNIWRFPGVAYKNGGGAFLIPYLVALLAAGTTFLLLDYALGHRYRGTPPVVFRRIHRRAELLGWWQVAVSFVIMVYYAVIIAWAARYVFFSFNKAWGDDPAAFFNEKFLATSANVEVSATPVLGVFIPLALVWLVIIVIIAFGVQRGLERANKIFLPLLVVLFAALVVRALTLPGAVDGLNQFFTPQWGALADGQVWLAAFSQIFYSLSVAFGIMLTYSSYLPRRSNLGGTGFVAAFANSSFEILAGIGVFATLGFMAQKQGVAVGDLEGITGISLSFTTFPQIISQMPGGVIFGVLFFTSLVLAGITSLLSLVQVVAGAVQDKFALSASKSAIWVGIVSGVVSLLLFGTKSSIMVLDVVDNYINAIGVIVCAILMTLTVTVVHPRLPELRAHINQVSSIQIGKWWDLLVGFIVPAMLASMLISTIGELLSKGYGEYPTWFTNTFGWGSLAVGFLLAFIFTLAPWKREVDTFKLVPLPTIKEREAIK